MIAHDDLLGAHLQEIETALTEEPLASAAAQTVAAFGATSDMLTHIGNLAVEYGIGKPLAVFQSLLVTYRALIGTQAAIAGTAESILQAAERLASDN